MIKIITHSVISGILTILIWYVVAYVVSTAQDMKVSAIIHNPGYFVEITLFVTGMLVYLSHTLVRKYKKPIKSTKKL